MRLFQTIVSMDHFIFSSCLHPAEAGLAVQCPVRLRIAAGLFSLCSSQSSALCWDMFGSDEKQFWCAALDDVLRPFVLRLGWIFRVRLTAGLQQLQGSSSWLCGWWILGTLASSMNACRGLLEVRCQEDGLQEVLEADVGFVMCREVAFDQSLMTKWSHRPVIQFHGLQRIVVCRDAKVCYRWCPWWAEQMDHFMM